MTYLAQISQSADFLISKGILNPEVGVVLGTGLGKFLDYLVVEQEIDYADIPHFPVSTVEFHKGKLLFGSIGSKKVIAMQGRFHLYEGYTLQQVTFPIRVLQKLGIKHLLLSNAAGGINKDFKKGDLILLDDHINLQGGSPLSGLNSFEYGGIFPDMSAPYDETLNNILLTEASKMELSLKKGVYASVYGPQLETRAEYRYLGRIGADMVGMSTTPEVIVANQLKLPCAAVSVITDECDPDHLKPVDIAEIIAIAGTSDEKLSQLFFETIHSIV
ncbi:Purine nucleoside phosphorylase 1 [Flavobacterium sp. CECT 9288]|uniref:purine-nucleoside phosphorylase n=1 Tax=Flavobacterium sp. CECT 9288 TaxID=2845819 RepID=UPI001E37A38D|nr:purine-nucleoside phosphorylase [Flavobacterium sp. CECT 9288]CAH0334932.1 Purine nucleoside phosphorylase 1 [Flavobacterium sp. CECT 9288]